MRMKGKLRNGRIKIKWIIWMNARPVKNDCVKMKRNVRRNMDQMKLKKIILLIMVNAMIGGHLIVRLGEKY